MIDRERLTGQMIQLTRDLVLIESTDARPEERRRCFQLIRNHLEEIADIEIQTLEKNGYESIVVMPTGCGRPEVLFCGHLDVVEHPDAESYRSEVRDGRIYGPGTGDMKGQLAILIQLMRHLWREHPGLPIGLAITSDEERGGESGVKFLVEEAGGDAGVAVIPDGGSLSDIIIEEKGILHLQVKSLGEAAHAARPRIGDNALERLTEGVRRIQETIFEPLKPAHVDPDDLGTHWFPTCSLTIIESSNDNPNCIPEEATATLDIRFVPPHSAASILTAIREVLPPRLSLHPLVSAEPTHLAPDDEFIAATREVTGVEPRIVRACGGSDGRFFFARGIPVMLSRTRVGNLHGRDEWIDVESMLDYFEICRRYVLKKTALST